MDFSLVCPIKNEANLIPITLPSFYALNPAEIILCFDNPPDEKAWELADKISQQYPQTPTILLAVANNADYKFQQAWIRRSGFLKAKCDRIVTTDIDLVLNLNVCKAVPLVGNDNVGLVSLSKKRYRKGPVGFIRNILDKIVRFYASLTDSEVAGRAFFTGLYCVYRPFWLDSEDDGIKKLVNPKNASLDLDAWGGYMGEDTYLRDCMIKKHKVLYLSEIGGVDLRPGLEDTKPIQIKIGRKYVAQGSSPGAVIRHSLVHFRPYVLGAYIHDLNRLKGNGVVHVVRAVFLLVVRLGLQVLRKVVPIRRGIARQITSSLESYEHRHEFLVSLLVKRMHGDVFVDIGGGFGYYSLLLRKNFQKIFVFEPDTKNHEIIKKALNDNHVRNARLESYAVADRDDRMVFFKTNPGVYGSLKETVSSAPYTVQYNPVVTMVDTVSLASYFKDVEVLDLVKVDVEGAEWLVLHGAESIMARIRRWIIELHNLDRRSELEIYLEGQGYRWKWLDKYHIYAWRQQA